MRNFWDRTWKDKQGRIVIWQTPNALLIAWLALTMLALLISGRLADVFAVAGEVALILWSLLEIFKGVNYFRRGLGVLVLFFAVATLLKSM